MKSEDRLLELDALRGLAALSVVIFHYTTRYNELYGSNHNLSFELAYGHYGVQLFFIISGFVIFMTVQNVTSLKKFVLKRAFRLYPTYIMGVIITFVIVKLFGLPGREVSNFDALVNLTMFQSFLGVPHVDGAYWSLQIELIFYFIIGGLIFCGFIEKYITFSYMWLISSLMIKSAALKTDNTVLKVLDHLLIVNYSHLFILGIVFYSLHQSLNKNLNHYIIILVCIFYEVIFFSGVSNIFTLSCILAFLLLINNKLKFLRFKPLLYLGTISYSLYIIHQNIGYVILNFLNAKSIDSELVLIVPLIITIILATLITYYIEKPVLKFLNNRYIYRNQKSKNYYKSKNII